MILNPDLAVCGPPFIQALVIGMELQWRKPRCVYMPIPIPTGAVDSILKSLFAPWLKRREQKEEFEQLKRELRHPGDVRNLSSGLVAIRKMLIADPKALERKENRAFFDKWCQQTFVKLGWLPGGEFWNGQNIAEFLTDLESVKL